MKPKSDKLEEKIDVLIAEYSQGKVPAGVFAGKIKAIVEEEKREAWQEGVEFAVMGLTALSQARVHKIPGMNSDKLARAMREALKDGKE